MKKRIGTIKGKSIIEGGDTNILTNNEILVQNNKIIVRKDNELRELGNSESSTNFSYRFLPEDIKTIKKYIYTENNYGNPQLSSEYDITDLIKYSNELRVFTISKTDYDELLTRASSGSSLYNDFYFNIKTYDTNNFVIEYSPAGYSNVKKTSLYDNINNKPIIAYIPFINQDSYISNLNLKYHKEFYLLVL